MSAYTVSALYHFTPFKDPSAIKKKLEDAFLTLAIQGTVLIAPEGINGTISGLESDIISALKILKALPGCAGLEHKESSAVTIPFNRLKIRLKKEIVTLGVEGVDPNQHVGTYVDPKDWNTLINEPGTIIIDTRNNYEAVIGSFKGAINPKTNSFRDFPEWFDHNKEALKGKKIAMFCTGGIRCEKSTSFLKTQGISDVYHLKGGILKYLENVPEHESQWWGECFVFDDRVALKHGLEQGSYDMCHACRRPITVDDKMSNTYVKGISCPHCYDERSETQRKRYAARQRQIDLAKQRGETHIGTSMPVKNARNLNPENLGRNDIKQDILHKD